LFLVTPITHHLGRRQLGPCCDTPSPSPQTRDRESSSHTTLHKTPVLPADEVAGITCFYHWHIDTALYDLSPPRVMTLYAIQVLQGPEQTCHYDDGMGDTLPVPLGMMAFVSGKTMFDILLQLQSIAVRTRVCYAPHLYGWMSPAAAHSMGHLLRCDAHSLVPLPICAHPPLMYFAV
jgi:hypothetical protein